MATTTIAEELTCPVCLEFYKDPRLLPCHHSLCKSCLVELRSKKDNDSNCEVQCPSCRHLFQAKDETHIESLPKNFTLASIVCKFQESLKEDKVFPCDVCEEGQKGRAIKKCLQCQLNYCRMCLEQLHPKRGALASHKLVHVMDAYGEKHENEESGSAFLSSLSENQTVPTQKYEQRKIERYCMSCDEICTKGDQSSADGNHEHHDTTEMQSAFRRKREEFECILVRLMDEKQDLEKGLDDITSLMNTIRKRVEEKMIELVQRFGKLAEEVERRKITAENRIEEEMKTRITSLESRLHELEDLKAKTKMRIAAFSELSSLTNDDASIFLIKLKELQNEIGPVTGDYIKRATIATECDSSLPIEQFMNEIIANAMQDIVQSERRLQIPDPNVADMDISSKNVIMAIKVTNVQKDGGMSADVEWVAIHQVDHYELSYFCDPGETVLRQNIVENRCRLTSLKWDSEYTITVTAYLPDGKTSFDSTVFKTDPKVKDTKPASTDISPKHLNMAVKVTNVQKGGTMSADVEWLAVYQAGQYEVSYLCNPDEIVLLKKITENRCILTNLRWNSIYTVKVTTQLQDGRTFFDQHRFKTDPHVKCYPMAASEICNEKFSVPYSFNEFTASNRIKNWAKFHKIGEFSGIVFTPVLTEEKHFWTMNIELSVFEDGSQDDDFFDFGIVNYSDLGQFLGLTCNTAAYSCSICTSRKGNFHLKFETPSGLENRSYQLPLKLYQKAQFCYGFMYDKINRQFAVMDCLKQKVLHVFHAVTFKNNDPPIFAVCPYHTEVKMRVETKLDHMHCTNENVSYWMRKIYEF